MNLEDRINTIINNAIQHYASFHPADVGTLRDIRVAIAVGLNNLKVKRLITGYQIGLQLTGTTISGNITYSPIRTVDSVVINVNLQNKATDAFDKAMRGI